MIKIAVLVSGGGTNLQALIDAQKAGAFPNGEIALVMASNQKAYALERAKNAGIESVVVSRKSFVDPADYDRAVVETLQSRGIELVVLAGFLSILGKPVIEAYPERILNIHPSLIPSFCGAGFYGLRVHQAALDYGVKVTGATVHLVNEIPDGGRILLQKAVEVLPGDTPESFAATVREVIALGAENVTVHTLALKKGSRFLTEGTRLPDGGAVGAMLSYAREALEAAGYAPYYLYRQKFMSGSFENVGWTKPGYRNLYNICIMEELCGILAVGAGGSTKLTAPGGIVKRIMAPKYPREYMERIAQTCAEKDEIVRFYNSEPKGTN